MNGQARESKHDLSDSLEKNRKSIRKLLGQSVDLVEREFALRKPEDKKGCLYYFDGLADGKVVQNGILEPLHRYEEDVSSLQILQESVVNTTDFKRITTLEQASEGMFAGLTLLLLDGSKEALLLNTIGGPVRSIDEPSTEPVIRGPRDGFTEIIRTNTALLRRRLHNPNLRIDETKVGRKTHTLVNIAYIEGLVKEGLVDEIKRRLDSIDMDSVIGSGYIEEMIDDEPLSPFVTTQATERPDKVAACLLEGRAAIFVDGTPFTLIVPATFWMFIQASDDYYSRYYVGSFFRLLRLAALIISLTLPSIYVLVASFHQEMMPTALALTIAAGREVVPFPVLFEVLLMELFFELMREAGLRMPRPIGSAVSIVGSLVIGQAAVQAGIVGTFAVIVVAVTGIASFSVPNYAISFSVRITRFPLLIASGTMGLLGFGGVLVIMLLHILSLKSFGQPYMEPLSPFRPSEQKDIILRMPWWTMKKRPWLSQGDPNRMRKGAMPGPDTFGESSRTGKQEEKEENQP
ncbi:spore germination protein [Gorillibacterium sp. sgz5001074]|uniref:spore germination protein n=1 Tax=Gorillibacterium sp. sgz5001074 TaxID=3446695 RepID=UPI003F66F4A0